MHSPDDRTAELIAAAVADALTEDERVEFDALRAKQPWVDAEVAELRALTTGLSASGVSWIASEPDPALRQRISAATGGSQPGAPHSVGNVVALGSARRRRWMLPAVGAACLAVGLAVGVALPAIDSTPNGPPGTLGAIEAIDLQNEPTGTTIDADVVAHTWGTEAVLDATGLEVGATYAVILVGADGTEFSAGAMLGSAVPIHCRVNAAVMREDVVRLEIRDAEAGIVAAADLPEV